MPKPSSHAPDKNDRSDPSKRSTRRGVSEEIDSPLLRVVAHALRGKRPESNKILGFAVTTEPPTPLPTEINGEPVEAVALVSLDEVQAKIDAVVGEMHVLRAQLNLAEAQTNAFGWGIDRLSEHLKLLSEEDFVRTVEIELEHRVPEAWAQNMKNVRTAKSAGGSNGRS